MKALVATGLALIVSQDVFAKCVPAKVTIDYPDEVPHVGMYHRVHPTGKYIIASGAVQGAGENRIAVIDLTSKDSDGNIEAKYIPSPLIDETYPVEGSWSHLASPRNRGTAQDGMRYYKFSDILEKNKDATPVFNDPQHDQWYHSAAELPGSKPEKYKFRTMLYGNRYRDYSFTYDKDGRMTDKTQTETKSACTNLTQHLDSPILSKDGTEIAHNTGNGTVIYKIKDDASCEAVDTIGYFTSKVSFSYPKAGKKGAIAFNANARHMVNGTPTQSNGIFIYDRDSKETRRITTAQENSAAYPGYLQDGRVAYILKNERQIVIVDPNQLNDDGTTKQDDNKCIHEESSSSAPAPARGNQSRRSNRQ